jgi:menaquinone-dependent protoporphyrinogen IX oxidase
VEKLEERVDGRVLAAYASKYGATAEITRKIGEQLWQPVSKQKR